VLQTFQSEKKPRKGKEPIPSRIWLRSTSSHKGAEESDCRRFLSAAEEWSFTVLLDLRETAQLSLPTDDFEMEKGCHWYSDSSATSSTFG
jgi:hypothetical protein